MVKLNILKIKPVFRSYSRWLLNLSFWETVIYFEFLNELFSYLFVLMAEFADAGNVFESYKAETIVEDVLLSIIIAPLIETLTAQWLPFVVLRRFTNRLWVIFVISSLIFAVGHTYSSWYIAATFVIGLIFIGLFSVLSKKSLTRAYWGVALVHTMSNTIAVLYEHW